MESLRDQIKAIQTLAGVKADGVFGTDSAAAVLSKLRAPTNPEYASAPATAVTVDDGPDFTGLDSRSIETLKTLDEKALPRFIKFLKLAKATAAAMSCEYRLIGGNRTWEEQDDLFQQGRGKPGGVVTNARGGYSWHNFRVAADAGVFQDGVYLDGGTFGQETLADKVHRACSVHAEACGLTWGGSWTSLKDLPHYQVAGLPSSPNADYRSLYQREGSVL